MKNMDFTKLQELLDSQITWPSYYTFKFIVNPDNKAQAMEFLKDFDLAERPSRSGKYTSITSKARFQSSEEVIDVYKKMKAVEGIISL